MKNPEKVKQGKKNRASGKVFENKVMKDLESKGWIVCRFTKNIEFLLGVPKGEEPLKSINEGTAIKSARLVNCKPKFNPFTKAMMMNSGGFPDFIAYHFNPLDYEKYNFKTFDVIGVESKSNGYLKPEEKEKCIWMLKNNIFSKILIAKKDKEGNIEYIEFKQ